MYDSLPKKDLKKYADRMFHMISEDRIICTEIPRTGKDIIERFKAISGLSSAVSDALDELGISGAVPASVIKPIPGQRNAKAVGNIVTLRFVPERTTCTKGVNDNLRSKTASRDVLALSCPGDIYVIDMDEMPISGCGGMAASLAASYGIAGIVVDGGIRDVEEIFDLNMPTWSRHITPVTCKHRVEAISINGAVVIGGVQANPGDLCVADNTGICFIPNELAERVLEICEAAVEKEKRLHSVMDSGGSVADMLEVMPADKW